MCARALSFRTHAPWCVFMISHASRLSTRLNQDLNIVTMDPHYRKRLCRTALNEIARMNSAAAMSDSASMTSLLAVKRRYILYWSETECFKIIQLNGFNFQLLELLLGVVVMRGPVSRQGVPGCSQRVIWFRYSLRQGTMTSSHVFDRAWLTTCTQSSNRAAARV